MGHLGVKVYEGDLLDPGIPQDFTNRQTVAPAKDQDIARRRNGSQSWMDQGFVITIFVPRAKLQVAVQKEPKMSFALAIPKDNKAITNTQIARKLLFCTSCGANR